MERDYNAEYEKEEKYCAEKKEVKYPNSTCYGISNRTDDGYYVLFADYDKIYLHVLLKELKNIWDKHKDYLSNFAILESTPSILTKNGTLGSYHAVSFAKLPYQKMQEILSYMSVDTDFFKLPKATAYRTNTLRISPKFKWEKEFDSETGDHVGNSIVLKEEPKFITWFPEEDHEPKSDLSKAHLLAYKKHIVTFRECNYFSNYSKDKLTKIEVKKYNSFGV